APESPLNGDDVIVTAKANDTVNPGDHVFFTVTDPNGNTNGQSVTFEDVAFDGDVASFSISNVTTGNYIVSAIVYDSDNESITEVVNTTISVADRSYSLKLSISNSPQLYGVAHLIAEANDTVNFGDYVIFKVTDPNGIVSSYTAPFDGNIASYDIQINPNGRYYFEAFAYNKNGEAILS
ncbi:MAG: hypothetical protein LBT66_01600, partial [Methanobrevibacter sp.]|nr:hypothetical protein [Candidatus Methanovirga meridionalis]